MSDKQQLPIDTIRLSRQERQRVIEQIQRDSRRMAPSDDRRRLRVDYQGHVVVCLKNPDSSQVRYMVTPRNLSAHGLGFIHGQYLHEDRPCDVMMSNLRQQWVRIPARIRSCRHLTKLIHDVGLVFDSPIALEEFVLLTPEQIMEHQQKPIVGSAAKTGNGSRPCLTGTVLVADDQTMDRSLYAIWLASLGLEVQQAASPQQMHRVMDDKSPDLLLVDVCVGGQAGTVIVEQLRIGGYQGPIILMTADESGLQQSLALAAGATAVLAKPVDRDSLQYQVEKLMLAGKAEAEGATQSIIRSVYADDESMQPLIQAYVAEVEKLSELISQARSKQDVSSLKHICSRLKSGGSYGFSPLTRIARQTLELMETSSSVLDLERTLDELSLTLRRIAAP
jgi:DNA-binding response OmpR family regulator